MIENVGVEILANYGFPVFVALWFMIRTEKVIKSNTAALILVGDRINRCPTARTSS